MARREHTLWAEKYRPKKLDTYVGNDHIKSKVKHYIETNDPPHLLFYGETGTGKTTLAKIIAENTDSDTLYVNASDETGVDMVRTKIRPFAATVSLSSIKLVILDEFDYITPNSQAALRNLMEQFSRTTRFILTCNYHDKIIRPIKSRCQIFEVFPPSQKEVAIHVAKILRQENVSFNPEDIKLLIDHTYPDIRQLINYCQRNSSDGKLHVNRQEILDSDFKLKLLDILLNEKDRKKLFKNVRQLVADNTVTDFTQIYGFLHSKVDDFAQGKTSAAILQLAEGSRDDTLMVDKEINFMSTMIKLISVIKE